MELKSTLNFEVTKNERTYRISIPVGAPYGEAYDSIFACLEGLVDLQKKGVEQLKAQNAISSETSPEASNQPASKPTEPVPFSVGGIDMTTAAAQ